MAREGKDSADLTSETGVLIVGSGPAGLTLAIELARRDVPFVLVDKDPERETTSRAIGTQARTVEVFQLMGIPESALTPAVRPRAFRLAERDRTLARISFEDRPTGPRLIAMDETDTERMLEARLEELGGRTTQGVELTGFQVDGDRVIATLQSAGEERQVRAQFLVGTDGAHSTVRQGAGIAFIGSAYPERFLLADLDLDWDLSHDEGHLWIGDEGLAAAIPLPGERRFRLIVPLSLAESMVEYGSETEMADRAETLLRERAGVRLHRVGDPFWASTFRISRRQAERYRMGPVFLAGDAAHVHSPIGAQGMNTGIQDAFNLGWKLALAMKGEAAPGLLDTYQAERHPIASSVLRGTDISTRLALTSNPIVRALRERLAPALINMAPVRRALIAAISQLGVRYRGSFLSVDADQPAASRGRRRERYGLEAGDRVADVVLNVVPDGEPVLLFDLIARGWVLLLFAGDDPPSERLDLLEALARETTASVSDAVQSFLILTKPLERELATPALLDSVGELGRSFGARDGLAALVRPDGYLGNRGRPDQAGELASYLARVFAMRLRGLERERPNTRAKKKP
jgi:2-polyprenyl-6-methoxyphenol hydroxylase-like FAD-dependent oxidoreductase